jgi:hypothetical protein
MDYYANSFGDIEKETMGEHVGTLSPLQMYEEGVVSLANYCFL